MLRTILQQVVMMHTSLFDCDELHALFLCARVSKLEHLSHTWILKIQNPCGFGFMFNIAVRNINISCKFQLCKSVRSEPTKVTSFCNCGQNPTQIVIFHFQWCKRGTGKWTCEQQLLIQCHKGHWINTIHTLWNTITVQFLDPINLGLTMWNLGFGA